MKIRETPILKKKEEIALLERKQNDNNYTFLKKIFIYHHLHRHDCAPHTHTHTHTHIYA